jgi:hypothetical protein
MEAEVTHCGILDMRVCVPKEWTDEQIVAFAEKEIPCGTVNGWYIKNIGEQCKKRPGNIHIELDA